MNKLEKKVMKVGPGELKGPCKHKWVRNARTKIKNLMIEEGLENYMDGLNQEEITNSYDLWEDGWYVEEKW